MDFIQRCKLAKAKKAQRKAKTKQNRRAGLVAVKQSILNNVAIVHEEENETISDKENNNGININNINRNNVLSDGEKTLPILPKIRTSSRVQ